MYVLRHVPAGIGLDLSKQVLAVAREAVTLPAYRINHHVTHE